METLYRARNWFASAPSILVLMVAIVMTALHSPTPMKKSPQQTPMRVTIAPSQVDPTPPIPEMPKIPEVTSEVAMPVIPQFTPRTTPKPSQNPTPKAASTPTPQEAADSTAPTVVSTQQPHATAPSAQPTNASEDDGYAAQVKVYLESIKHYPTSKEARLQRPRGSVTVWIVIDRLGGMKEAGIDESSGSLILDGAALSTVRNGSYPSFPANAFQGQATHRFTVQLHYSMS